MSPMWLDSAKAFFAKISIPLLAVSSCVFAQAPFDSSVARPDSVVDADLLLLSNMQEIPDSVAAVPVAADSAAPVASASAAPVLKDSTAPTALPSGPLKSVLYLGGGKNSAWYHLGVLYAIEGYSIPVDSVVGVSWGAFVGFLWAKGMPLDDIQRVLLDPYIADIVGQNEMDDLYDDAERTFELPVSVNGMPSLRHRFTVSADTSGNLYRNVKPLEPDTAHIRRALARLRIQESLYRQPAGFVIPFDVSGMEDDNGAVVNKVYKSLPLRENARNGELGPYVALPYEDEVGVLPLLSIADPKMLADGSLWKSPWQNAIAQKQMQNLGTQPGVMIRAHSVSDTTRSAWIQAGFSAVERRLGEMMVLRPRMADYVSTKRKSTPWFRFTPAFDSLSAELQSSAKTYWNANDTAMMAPENFAKGVMSQPAYDSVSFTMQPSGDVLIGAVVRPTFDVYAGGFGSNAIGPNVYAGVAVSYVDQMEFLLDLPGFWGNESYGFMPHLQISRLWNRRWSLDFGYDLMKLRPLKKFSNGISEEWRIYSEERRDLTMSVGYQLDDLQKVSLHFLFGDRTFELDSRLYNKHEFETYPVSPSLNYELLSGEKDRWFAKKGFEVDASVGLQSIGFEFGLSNVIPIYWKLAGEARFTHSPTDFFTFNVAAAAGLNAYHNEGHGYVYPESFDYRVMDNCYRQKVKATPWTTEWYNPDMASHHYGLIRLNAGLHYGVIGAWVFGAYVRDYEDNPSALLGENKIVLEPALRFAYKSISAYVGMSRIVDNRTMEDLQEIGDYQYFVRIGNYDLF